MVNLNTVKAKVDAADAKQGTGGLLRAKVDAASATMLRKKVNPHQVWQVHAVIDRSGSMGYEYRDGTVQEVVNRLLGFGVIVDDDGEVPLYLFDHNVDERTVSLDDFHDYIGRNRISAGGSTDLTKALAAVARNTGNGDLLSIPAAPSPRGGGLFGRRQSTSVAVQSPTVKHMATPGFVIIVTDGVPNDPDSATDLIRKLSYRGLFLKFLFVGHDSTGWQYLESLDDDIPVGVPYEQGGRLIDNVDAKNVGDIRNLSDEDFYGEMFDEVPTWLAAAKQSQLI